MNGAAHPQRLFPGANSLRERFNRFFPAFFK